MDVDAFIAAIDHEINFARLAYDFPILATRRTHLAYVNGVAATYEFIIERIFDEMRHFHLPVPDVDVANAEVGGIAFHRRLEVSLALDIVFPGFCNQKGFLKVVEVTGNRRTGARGSHDGLDGVGEFLWIGNAADIAHDDIGQGLENGVGGEFVPVGDVFQVNRTVEVFKVTAFFLGCGHQDAFREASEKEVVFKGGRTVGKAVLRR